MGYGAIIAAVLKGIILWFTSKVERDKRRRKLQEEALSELKEGIKRRDPSIITAAFNRANRLR